MNSGAATCRSILDKPLAQLTEDDISQLTREDCRKFLKEKGMRRPSWNKSQAIQQVISLKALLDPPDDHADVARPSRRFPFVSAPQDNNINHNYNNNNDDDDTPPDNSDVTGRVEVSSTTEPAEEVPYHAAEELPKSVSSIEKPTNVEFNEKDVSPRGCATSGPAGQMTIFYCGKVNVYDGVPPDKARAIMQLAASPIYIPQDEPFKRSTSVWPCHLQMDKDTLVPIDGTISQFAQPDKMAEYPLHYREKGSTPRDSDGQASRKMSLQRYREKRKDRGRLKSKKFTGVTSNMEMYFSHQVKTHASNGNSSRSSTSSPPQPRLPQASGGSADSQLKIALPVDLNHKDFQEC